MKSRNYALLSVSTLVSLRLLAAPPLESLTLDQALTLAENGQPQIAEARALVEAAEGRVQQAGAWPNPEAIAGAQQMPLRGGGANDREYVAGVGLTVPVGGRVAKAREAERLEREIRARGLEATHREIRQRVHSSFAKALYHERALQLQSELARHAARTVDITRTRLESGDALREELARAEMELGRARVDEQRAEAMRAQSLVALAAAMGDATLVVKSLRGSLEETFEIPTLESLAANLPRLPESEQAEAGVRASVARLDLAKSERIPDVKVEALYHRLDASKANTFDLGVSIPLPLFNRGQGRVKEARAEVAAAEARSRRTQNEQRVQLHESYSMFSTALANRRVYQTEVIPYAETARKSAEARYAVGDISLAEVLPIRRDWASVQLGYLESLRDVMQAWAAIKALTPR
jgi:cobalt-zinc-cadmium efflux system outer membrane protein